MIGPHSIELSDFVDLPQADVQHVTRLTEGTYTLERHEQFLRVISGFAWVTVDREDFILAQGQEVQIKPGSAPVLIEAMRHQPLIFVEYES